MKHADKALQRLQLRRKAFDVLSVDAARGRKRPGSLKKPMSLK